MWIMSISNRSRMIQLWRCIMELRRCIRQRCRDAEKNSGQLNTMYVKTSWIHSCLISPLKEQAGARMGYFSWTPNLPNRNVPPTSFCLKNQHPVRDPRHWCVASITNSYVLSRNPRALLMTKPSERDPRCTNSRPHSVDAKLLNGTS